VVWRSWDKNMRKHMQWRVVLLVMSLMIPFLLVHTTPLVADPFADTLVSVIPNNTVVGPAQFIELDIYCAPGQPVKSFEFKLQFDPSLLQANVVSEGNIFTGYSTFFNAGTIDNIQGTIIDIYGLIMGAGNVSSPGILATINFTSDTGGGQGTVDLYDVGLTNETNYVTISLDNGTITVDASPPAITDNSPSIGTTGDNYIFDTTVIDNISPAGNLTVKVDWSHGSQNGNDTMSHIGGSVFQKTITLDPTSVTDLTYSLYTIDDYGNSESTALQSITVSDNDAPQISNMQALPPTQNADGNVNLSVDVTDNIAVGAVYLDIIYPDSSVQNISITANNTGNNYYRNTTYSLLGQYTYNIFSQDTSGNGVLSGSDTFTIVDNLAPLLSNLSRATATPLDTDPLFGWINISCNAIDNIAVNDVKINISDPQASTTNVSMNELGNGRYFYNSSTFFSSSGQYNYFIWAVDNTGNSVVSISFSFDMSPNWDIDENGVCSVFDLVLISNVYDSSGSSGWIREDVDNNGVIQVLDLVLVSNHYGESW
jgi:hypothetical protein